MTSIANKSQIARAVVDTANKFAQPTDTKTQKASDGAKAKEAPNQTALERHISFFENLSKPGTVNAQNTRGGLEALGLTGASNKFGGHALTVPFAIPQNSASTKAFAASTRKPESDRILASTTTKAISTPKRS